MNRNTFALSTGGGKCMGTEGNIKAILKLKPQVLVAMPTFIYHVLQQAIDENARIEGVRLICLGGEKVPDGMRRKLSAMCAQLGSPNVRVIATYGFTEAKLAFTECPFDAGRRADGLSSLSRHGDRRGRQSRDGRAGARRHRRRDRLDADQRARHGRAALSHRRSHRARHHVGAPARAAAAGCRG